MSTQDFGFPGGWAGGGAVWRAKMAYNESRSRLRWAMATARSVPLAEVLQSMTAEGELYRKHPDGSLTCYACGHACLIRPGRDGICKVRGNRDGVLRVPR